MRNIGVRNGWLNSNKSYFSCLPRKLEGSSVTKQVQHQKVEKNSQILTSDNSNIRNLELGTSFGDKPSCSVVIATADRPQELRDCVASVIVDTSVCFELIIVDDSSDANNAKENQNLLNELNFGRARYVRNKNNLGLPSSRNIGNALAETDYIVVQDDDDLMAGDRLRAQLGLFDAKTSFVNGSWLDFSIL